MIETEEKVRKRVREQDEKGHEKIRFQPIRFQPSRSYNPSNLFIHGS